MAYCNCAYSRDDIAVPPERLMEHLEEMEYKAVIDNTPNIARSLAIAQDLLRKREKL